METDGDRRNVSSLRGLGICFLGDRVMDGEQSTRRKQSAAVLATIERQFTSSRVERELLAQVFQMAWSIGQRHSERTTLDREGAMVVVNDLANDVRLLAASTEGA